MKKLYLRKQYRKEKSEPLLLYLQRLYNDFYGFPATFSKSNESGTNVSERTCSSGKARSFGDIYSVLLTQGIKISFSELCKAIKVLIELNITKTRLAIIFCPDIKKWVVHTWDNKTIDKFQKKEISITTLIILLKSQYRFGVLVNNYSDSIKEWNNKGVGEYSLYNILKGMGYLSKEIKEGVKRF